MRTWPRYLPPGHLETWPDVLAESIGIALHALRDLEAERHPCDCGAGGSELEAHGDDCEFWERHDPEVLQSQLDELHQMASRACARSKADPAIWVDGPDSEAARAARSIRQPIRYWPTCASGTGTPSRPPRMSTWKVGGMLATASWGVWRLTRNSPGQPGLARYS